MRPDTQIPEPKNGQAVPESAASRRVTLQGRMLAGAGLLIVVGFWPTFRSLHRVWTGEVYSHGYFVAALVAFLVWRSRGRIWPPTRSSGSPFLTTLLLSLLWLLAAIMNLQAVQQGALALMLISWTWGALGPRAMKALAPIGATFLLALPIWDPLVPVLQKLSVIATSFTLALLRIPATVRGDIISLPDGLIKVAGTCAGLNSFLVGMALGAAFCHLFLRRWRSVLAVMTLAAFTSMFANWIRVASLAVIGHLSGMTSGLLSDHITYGWVIFSLSLVPFFFLALKIDRREQSRIRTLSEGEMPHDLSPSPLEMGTLHSVRGLILVTALALMGPAVFWGFRALPPGPGESFSSLTPSPASAWAPVNPDLPRPHTWEPAYGGFDDQVTAMFSENNAVVVVDRLLFDHQRQGAELIGSTNRVAAAENILQERVVGPLGPEARWVREALVRTQEGAVVVWYWYRVGGGETPFPHIAKLLELWAFFQRTPQAELVSVSAACSQVECLGALGAIQTYLQEVW